MSPEPKQLVASVSTEPDYINREKRIAQQLRTIHSHRAWDEIETHAAASTLHSIYTGMERCLVLVLKLQAYPVPDGSHWHQEVLERSHECGALDENLRDRLQEYLAFRHMYRNAYGFMLDSELVAPLINRVDSLENDFERSIRSFINQIRVYNVLQAGIFRLETRYETA